MSIDEPLHTELEEHEHRGRFRLLAGDREVGEMTFSRSTPDLVIVDHTETDDSIRGRGGGRVLFDAMVAWARRTNTKVLATCPFALSMFERHPESRDVLAG